MYYGQRPDDRERRIRERRAVRYGFIIAACVIAVSYSRRSSLGVPDSDVVELVHFVEYGMLTWLFYRAWRPLGDLSVLVLPFLCALTAGTLEEWFQ
jgi:hypothetical protein